MSAGPTTAPGDRVVLDVGGAVAEEVQGVLGLAERQLGPQQGLPLQQQLGRPHLGTPRRSPGLAVGAAVREQGDADGAERRALGQPVVVVEAQPDLLHVGSRRLEGPPARQGQQRGQQISSHREDRSPGRPLGIATGLRRSGEALVERGAEGIEQLGLDVIGGAMIQSRSRYLPRLAGCRPPSGGGEDGGLQFVPSPALGVSA